MSCRKHEPCEIEALPTVVGVDGKPMMVVAVWAVDTASGGPEEGGWWYEVGELEHLEFHTIRQIAELRVKELREKYPYTGKRTSFGSDKDDHTVTLYDDGRIPHSYFPLVRPHYE